MLSRRVAARFFNTTPNLTSTYSLSVTTTRLFSASQHILPRHQQRNYGSPIPRHRTSVKPDNYPNRTLDHYESNMASNSNFRADKLFDLSGKVALVTGKVKAVA